MSDLALLDRPDLRVLESATSTNDIARAWARAGAAEGATVVADVQTAGRGRLDRSWHSPPGVNLYLSQIFCGPVGRLKVVPLLGALATREAVSEYLPLPRSAVIKWPNDILVEGYKLAGILTELIETPEPVAILGIGVNLNLTEEDFPQGLRRPAASLRMLRGQELSRRAFLQSLLERLDFFRGLLHQAPEKLVETFIPHCLTLGKPVQVFPPGRDSFFGIARRIDPDGVLVVETHNRSLLRVEAGDVDLVDQR